MSTSSDPPAPGAIIQIAHSDGLALAVVESVAKDRLRVHTEAGELLAISPLKLVRMTPFRVPTPVIADAAATHLATLREAIDEHVGNLDLKTIWELLVTEGDGFSLEDITGLWFGEIDPAGFFAMAAALDADQLLFKRKGELLIPRPQADVDRLLAVAEARIKRVAERKQFAQDVARALTSKPGAEAVDLFSVTEYRRFLDLLLDYSAHGNLFERKKEAQKLLGELSAALGSAIGRSSEATFKLLASLGILEKHENLALRRYRICTTFTDENLEHAQKLALAPVVSAQRVPPVDSANAFTIDAEETRDLDDAIHVDLLPDGEIEVGIHITDVGSLIEPGSPLDKSARRRGASLYLPTGVIPMFPRILSEERLSLIRGEERPALSYLVRFDADGDRLHTEIRRTRLTVAHRLTYDEADQAIDDPAHCLHQQLTRLAGLARTLRGRRDANGAIAVALPEVRVRVRGDDIHLEKTPPSQSREIVAELMVLAGELTAELCQTNAIPTVYRAQALVTSAESLAYLDGIEDSLARALEQVRHMRRGELRSQPEPHHGLGLSSYSPVTSPMRRYADLVVNYQVRRFLGGEPLAFDEKKIVEVAGRAELAAQACASAQRDSDRYWLLEYLRRTSSEPVEAMVLYVDPRHSRPTNPVILPDTMLRANIRVRGLKPGYRLDVRVERADPRQDLLQVTPV